VRNEKQTAILAIADTGTKKKDSDKKGLLFTISRPNTGLQVRLIKYQEYRYLPILFTKHSNPSFYIL
jgi:hypothetical protein